MFYYILSRWNEIRLATESFPSVQFEPQSGEKQPVLKSRFKSRHKSVELYGSWQSIKHIKIYQSGSKATHAFLLKPLAVCFLQSRGLCDLCATPDFQTLPPLTSTFLFYRSFSQEIRFIEVSGEASQPPSKWKSVLFNRFKAPDAALGWVAV